MDKKTSDAQMRATRKWQEKNPERRRYNSYKSSARSFIRNHATFEDLEELKEIIAARESFLENQE